MLIPDNILASIAAQTGATSVEVVDHLQVLWSGYGQLVRINMAGCVQRTAIVKYIDPPDRVSHPRGWDSCVAHERKLQSYVVETNWYQHYSHECSSTFKVPLLLASGSDGPLHWLLLEDLTPLYPVLKQQLSVEQAFVCLRWLANFHAHFLYHNADLLWPIGTYWHLATRQDEYAKMPAGELKQQASNINKTLHGCQHKTLVHGDAKVVNFCFSPNLQQVAAVDFQYTGAAAGINDVAYFLGSCLPHNDLAENETVLLDDYFLTLQQSINSRHGQNVATAVVSEWRSLYAIACTDFYRFLLGWMPTHSKINAYTLQKAAQAFELLALDRSNVD